MNKKMIVAVISIMLFCVDPTIGFEGKREILKVQGVILPLKEKQNIPAQQKISDEVRKKLIRLQSIEEPRPGFIYNGGYEVIIQNESIDIVVPIYAAFIYAYIEYYKCEETIYVNLKHFAENMKRISKGYCASKIELKRRMPEEWIPQEVAFFINESNWARYGDGSYISVPLSVEEVESISMEFVSTFRDRPQVPFAYQNEQWEEIKADMEDGDLLLLYQTAPGRHQTRGVAVVGTKGIKQRMKTPYLPREWMGVQ